MPATELHDAPPGDAGRTRRVWIVNQYAGAPDEATGTRHHELARQLIARGHTVTIFAGNFTAQPGRRNRLRPGSMAHAERHEGVRFVWLWTVSYLGNTWRRPLNMLSFVVTFLVAQAREPAPDVVIGSTVHPFAALGAWLAARLRGATFMFEIRDLWPQTLVDLGAMRVGSPGERMLRAIEAFLVRHAAAVITLLPGVAGYLREQGLPDAHVTYIPNGADLASFDAGGPPVAGPDAQPTVATGTDPAGPPAELAASLEAIRSLRDQGRFVIGYIGAFGRVNRVDLLVLAAIEAERRDPGRIGLVVVGEGPQRPEIERVAAGQPFVVVGQPIAKRVVPAVLRELDATVVHTTYTPVYRYGISFNKLFEYMAAERPVVFACDTSHDPVQASGAGFTIQPDDADRLATAFLEMAALAPAELARMGAAGRAYVTREHDFERLGERLASLIEALPRAHAR